MLKDNSQITKGKLFNKFFILLIIINTTYCFAMNAMNNAISLYIDYLGESTAISGMISVPFAVAAIIFRFVGGYMTDHIGRRFTMLLGCAIFAVGAYFFGAVPVIAALFVFRGLTGAGYALANTSAAAANVDCSPPEHLSTASGIFYVPSAVTQAVCGYLVLFFAERSKYGELFTVVSVALLAGVLFSFLCNYEKQMSFTQKSSETKSTYKGLRKFFDFCALKPAIAAIVMCTCLSICSMFILKYAGDYGISNAGMFFTITAVVMFLLNIFNGQLVRRFGELPLMIVCCAFFAFTCIGLGLTNSPVFYFLTAAGYGAVFGGCFPVLLALALEPAAPDRRGAASSLVLVANDIGVGLGATIWGIIINAVGFDFSFITAGCVSIAAIVLCVFFFSRKAGK